LLLSSRLKGEAKDGGRNQWVQSSGVLLRQLSTRILAKNESDLSLQALLGLGLDRTENTDNGRQILVHGLWADIKGGGSISASWVPNGNEPYLHIDFKNSGGWPGDVTIRPCGLEVLDNKGNHRFLNFYARPKTCSAESPIVMAVRLVDTWGTHWRATGDIAGFEYKPFVLDQAGAWHAISVPLSPNLWRKFDGSGNHHYSADKPDSFR